MNSIATDNDVLALKDLSYLIQQSWLPGLIGFIAFGVLGGAVSLLVQPEYQAEVLLEFIGDPTKQERLGGGASGLGGLAAFAGISLGSDGNPKDAAIALLRSRGFAEEFISENDLLPILNADDWDDSRDQWDDPANPPSLWRTIRRFRRDVLYVSDDARTGLVSVIVTWKDPDIAARWAQQIVSRINARLKEATIAETSRSIDHLNLELTKTQNPELQRAIARLLQARIEALMFADIRDEFAFRTIDPALAPPDDEYEFPNHILFVIIGGLVGSFLTVVFWILGRSSIRPSRSKT